jgi:hypothetical protein
MDFYVYIHRRASNGAVFYVGKGVNDRAWQASPRRRSAHWRSIVKKHGLVVEIVADGLQEWYAHELERELIALYGRRDLGLGPLINLTDGGEGGSGRKLSAESTERHAARTRAAASTPEWRDKQAQAARARSNSIEWKTRNQAGAQKRSASRQWREKIRAAAVRRSADQDYRKRLSMALTKAAADPDWRRRNTETNRKIRAKPVICVETGRVFGAGADALLWLRSNGWPKASSSTLSAACKGRAKTAYGHTWRYG